MAARHTIRSRTIGRECSADPDRQGLDTREDVIDGIARVHRDGDPVHLERPRRDGEPVFEVGVEVARAVQRLARIDDAADRVEDVDAEAGVLAQEACTDGD